MQHIRKFENLNTTRKFKFTTVIFNGSEIVKALYINNVLFKYGDYYHDKIDTKLSAFIEGVKWSGIELEENTIECNNSDVNNTVCELGDIPPENLSDL